MGGKRLTVGTVVRLKSGGPHMTVEHVTEPRYWIPSNARCTWYAGTTRMHDTFDVRLLVEVEP